MENKSEDLVCPITDQNDVQSKKYGFLIIGEHENQVFSDGEAALSYFKKYCQKNPGHAQFIPIESFSLHHLPVGYQDSDLYEFIKATADLTVRLSVTLTSPDRPEFWPNTQKVYLLSNMRGKKILRTGTGLVCEVRNLTDEDKQRKYERKTCPCDKCKASDEPSKVWWEIHVETAAHVVFDDTEANHTALRLFYDREDSPEVILKDNVHVYYVNFKQDMCRLTCVACDENVVNKLKKRKKDFIDFWGKVVNKYVQSEDIHKLSFIVSHPHGCSKQVSVGQLKDVIQVGFDKLDHQLTYTTCTCPGSSGANVYCVGNGRSNVHVHSGTLKSGLNYSSVNWF